ncbi:hypothetical protein [uncultured Megasphaera sp.]|uniref:SEL1-like repeat protein n=1 Tax=uncultured Megasphaera sp. TaxID=165188 RepID=UPI002657C32E|nr:hypothetical protein [uncultured Megasphaera sp.]
MPNELNLIQTDAFTTQEKTELGQQIDRMIEAHKNNRQDINRLVFESIAIMTEADDAQRQLDQKGTVKKFLGRFTGSNEKLQSTINKNRSAAQYAAQQTLQKLAEQNLMTFDLISAVNNKLNASMYAVGEEFTKLYAGLGKFLKHNRSEMVRMETRLAKVEKNVQLLTWQNSIEYLEFDGEEYADMDDTKKIVCLVRDFYDITKGNWSTSDLLLLKTAMSTIDIQPKSQVNYFAVLKQIAYDDTLKNKLLGNGTLQSQPSPEDLMSLSVVKKLDSLQHEDAHVVDTMADLLEQQGVTADKQKICSNMTKNYLQQEADVNIDMDVDSYDMMLDLLYNLKQADTTLCLDRDSCFNAVEHEDAEEEDDWDDYGNSVEENEEDDVRRYRKAAEQGDPSAQYELGKLYANGDGSRFPNAEAVKWYRESAEQGNPSAQYALGTCYDNGYFNGDEFEYSKEEAVKWYRKAAEQGNPFAQYALSQCEDDDEEAAEWCRKAAELGLADAQSDLGQRYLYGLGVEPSDKEGVKWYRKAAEQGDDDAQWYLGNFYMDGTGVAQNSKEGVKWYRKAAEQGNSLAQYDLGECYGHGYGVEQSNEEAVKWYRKAAEQRNLDAEIKLGDCYYNGWGIEQNHEEAVKWYRKVAEQGSLFYDDATDDAKTKLGDCYCYGIGVEQNYKEAMKWYREAAENGYRLALSGLGDLYYNGWGVEQNYEEAEKWYRKAADQE